MLQRSPTLAAPNDKPEDTSTDVREAALLLAQITNRETDNSVQTTEPINSNKTTDSKDDLSSSLHEDDDTDTDEETIDAENLENANNLLDLVTEQKPSVSKDLFHSSSSSFSSFSSSSGSPSSSSFSSSSSSPSSSSFSSSSSSSSAANVELESKIFAAYETIQKFPLSDEQKLTREEISTIAKTEGASLCKIRYLSDPYTRNLENLYKCGFKKEDICALFSKKIPKTNLNQLISELNEVKTKLIAIGVLKKPEEDLEHNTNFVSIIKKMTTVVYSFENNIFGRFLTYYDELNKLNYDTLQSAAQTNKNNEKIDQFELIMQILRGRWSSKRERKSHVAFSQKLNKLGIQITQKDMLQPRLYNRKNLSNAESTEQTIISAHANIQDEISELDKQFTQDEISTIFNRCNAVHGVNKIYFSSGQCKNLKKLYSYGFSKSQMFLLLQKPLASKLLNQSQDFYLEAIRNKLIAIGKLKPKKDNADHDKHFAEFIMQILKRARSIPNHTLERFVEHYDLVFQHFQKKSMPENYIFEKIIRIISKSPGKFNKEMQKITETTESQSNKKICLSSSFSSSTITLDPTSFSSSPIALDPTSASTSSSSSSSVNHFSLFAPATNFSSSASSPSATQTISSSPGFSSSSSSFFSSASASSVTSSSSTSSSSSSNANGKRPLGS